MSRISIGIVDDHPVVRQGLVSMLEGQPDLQVLWQAGDGSELQQQMAHAVPDVLLLDIRLPGVGGIALARRLRQTHAGLRIVILTTYDDEEYVDGAIQAGADAYILKTAAHEELIDCIRAVHGGEKRLSRQVVGTVWKRYQDIARLQGLQEMGLGEEEVRLLGWAAQGATNRDIAQRGHWSEITVKQKFQAIFRKLGARDRTEAVAIALRRGLI